MTTYILPAFGWDLTQTDLLGRDNFLVGEVELTFLGAGTSVGFEFDQSPFGEVFGVPFGPSPDYVYINTSGTDALGQRTRGNTAPFELDPEVIFRDVDWFQGGDLNTALTGQFFTLDPSGGDVTGSVVVPLEGDDIFAGLRGLGPVALEEAVYRTQIVEADLFAPFGLGPGTIAFFELGEIGGVRITEDDFVAFGSADDFAAMGPGADRALAGGGDDIVRGEDGDDDLFGEAGRDVLRGNRGADLIDGGAGDDRLFGDLGDDVLRGRQGNDRLGGGSGDDTLNGNLGDDLLRGAGGNDVLRGAQGDDTLFAGGGADRLFGGTGDDQLFGGPGSDTLFGGGGGDTLRGGDGGDVLFGGAGSDVLRGMDGNDQITGGAGLDVFVFDGRGDDVARDFGPLDVIDAERAFALTRNDAGDVVIVGGGGSLTLLGVSDIAAVEDSIV